MAPSRMESLSRPMDSHLGIVRLWRGAMQVAVATLVASASCVPRSASGANETQRLSAQGDQSSCVGSRADSDPVAYTTVDLGPGTRRRVPFVPGPAERVLVQTADDWQSVWRRVADTLAVPRVGFRDSAVVLVASPVYGSGPGELRIEELRRCRSDSSLVVFVRLYAAARRQAYQSRSLRAVAIARINLGPHGVRFVDRDTVVYH
jgi:hypothetical protein